MTDSMGAKPNRPQKYEINIEGTTYGWNQATITVAQLRELGKLPLDTPVIEVDLKTNAERTLADEEAVEIRPGQGFGRKVSFKRG